jgi:hypothetical protein
MNYIELFGMPASGKTFYKNKIYKKLKKKKFFNPKNIIINFYLKNESVKPKSIIRSYLLLFFYSRFISIVKFLIRRKRFVKKSDLDNKLYFYSSKKKWYHKVIDLIGLDSQYQEILKILERKFKIKSNNLFYKKILTEISKLNQNLVLKDKLRKWFLENILLIDILKKKKDIYCVIDEGIIHKIYIIFSLKNRNQSFVKRIIKYLDNYGQLYLIKTNLKQIHIRSKKRKKKSSEFIYQSYQQIAKEYNKLREFEKLIKKKIIYKKILN